MPAFNEEAHIERVIRAFLETEYPNLIEILVADGGSTDKTREIVARLSEEDVRVKLVDNPDKYQSFALNKIIDTAAGEILLRADAHCFYHPSYVEKCVEHLVRTGARNVGGAQRYRAMNAAQAGISLAVKSFLGNGGAKYMNLGYEGYADTVFLGCFWTEDLRQIGGFSVKNITNQDSELNLRLIKAFGKRSIYIHPDIKVWYYPRDTFYKLFKQYFRYGRGRFITVTNYPLQSPLRGILPFLFVLALLLYIIVDSATDMRLGSPLILGLFSVLVCAETARIVLINRKNFADEMWGGTEEIPSVGSRFINTLFTIIVMQIAFFCGFSLQLLRRLLLLKKGW